MCWRKKTPNKICEKENLKAKDGVIHMNLEIRKSLNTSNQYKEENLKVKDGIKPMNLIIIK